MHYKYKHFFWFCYIHHVANFLYDIFGLVWRLCSSQTFSSWFFKSTSFLWGRRQNYLAHESITMHRTLFSEIVILEFRITLPCLFLSVYRCGFEFFWFNVHVSFLVPSFYHSCKNLNKENISFDMRTPFSMLSVRLISVIYSYTPKLIVNLK